MLGQGSQKDQGLGTRVGALATGSGTRWGPGLTHIDPPQGKVLVFMGEAMGGCQDPLVRDEGPSAGLMALGL